MSQETNTELLETARDLQEYFASNLWDRVLQRDIDSGDMEALAFNVSRANAERQMEMDAEIA